MKITNVRAHVLRSALPQPFAFSQGWVSSRGATLVEVETDEGVTGWGEACARVCMPDRRGRDRVILKAWSSGRSAAPESCGTACITPRATTA
jgi:L-alanine-DL-glutamate epimerase-like enolase superfamily enzyme